MKRKANKTTEKLKEMKHRMDWIKRKERELFKKEGKKLKKKKQTFVFFL